MRKLRTLSCLTTNIKQFQQIKMEKVEQNDNVNRDELIMQQQREIEKEVRIFFFNPIRFLSHTLSSCNFLFKFATNIYLHLHEFFHR